MNAPLPSLRPHQIELLQRTVARDCSREEFDLFMAAAQSHGLDPFRKQIEPLILNKQDPAKRRMVILVTIHGQRIIAQRCGNYRAASEPTDFVTDETLRSATNPQGILLARVYLWQQDRSGTWFPIVGEAYWDEFVPLLEVVEEDPETGALRKTGEKRLDPVSPWARMPRLMIGKCATSQALRAGWPEQFGGLYLQEEFDRIAVAEAAASDIAAREREQRRLRAIAGNDAITVSWTDAWELENVPLLDFSRRARAWLQTQAAGEVRRWADANREALRFFWAKVPVEALELKRLIEQHTTSSAWELPAAGDKTGRRSARKERAPKRKARAQRFASRQSARKPDLEELPV